MTAWMSKIFRYAQKITTKMLSLVKMKAVITGKYDSGDGAVLSHNASHSMTAVNVNQIKDLGRFRTGVVSRIENSDSAAKDLTVCHPRPRSHIFLRKGDED